MKYWFLFLKDNTKNIAIITFFRVIGALFEGISFSLFIPLFYSVTIGNYDLLNTKLSFLFNFLFKPFMTVELAKRVYIIFAFLFLGIIIKNLLVYTANLLNSKLQYHILADLRNKIFYKYLKVPYNYMINNDHGKLLHNILIETDYVSVCAYIVISQIGRSLTTLILIGILLIISWKLTILLLLLLLLLFSIFFLSIRNFFVRSKQIGNEKGRLTKIESGFINEALQGIRQVLIFKAENRLFSKYSNLNHNLTGQSYSVSKIRLFTQPLLEISTVFIIAVSLFITVHFNIIEPDLRAPIIITFLAIMSRLLPIANTLNQEQITFNSLNNSLQNTLNILSEPEFQNKGEINFNTLKNKIYFKNVNFEYKIGIPVLKKINAAFSKNKITAIVGSSGSGKSTIIDLLVGLYKPLSGEIYIDNSNLKDINIDSLRKKIGYVTQDTFIFYGTVKDNITFGNPDVSGEEIINAAKKANAHEFIMQLPDKYNTIVGERGLKLSGGQRQRIAIARALLINPEILIFDEATSSLDTYSENAIHNAIEKISKNNTIIMVAHRLSTVINADKIIVLKNGSIVEEGNHNELIKKKGEYAKLYKKSK